MMVLIIFHLENRFALSNERTVRTIVIAMLTHFIWFLNAILTTDGARY